ncbi:MAG TPA: hypothetical protein PKD85_04475 [Saprospiraceae bacterium]|nr:hypothetical protein [Saprospiraceae bacterium]
MSQLTLEFSNKDDLNLVLSVARRLKAEVLYIKSDDDEILANKDRKVMLQKQSIDSQFLTDVNEITMDFINADLESK